MTKNLKYDTIIFEGIDKTGKDYIKNILFHIDNGKYVHVSRGLLSVIVYNDIYNRENYVYNINSYKSSVIVLLTCDYDDWKIRCKLTNEKPINYEQQLVFERHVAEFESLGIKVLRINTTNNSPYNIANEIYKYMETLNYEN